MEWSSLFMVVLENSGDSFLLAKLSMVNAFLTTTTPSAAPRTDIKLTKAESVATAGEYSRPRSCKQVEQKAKAYCLKQISALCSWSMFYVVS